MSGASARLQPASPAAPPRASSDVPVPRIAVLIPCFDEAPTIGRVVEEFRMTLPQAEVFVFDNNSTDGSATIAEAAGATVRRVRQQGKGHVVRRMFADVEAACYIMVDGDGTYDAGAAALVAALVLEQGYDFVNVARRSSSVEAYRPGHRLGNVVLSGLIKTFFGRDSTDMLSGYKAVSRRFVKSFPAGSDGFETETELTVHALEMRMSMIEVAAAYRERPAGSASKLQTYRDGLRILLLIARLIKDERPLPFFGLIGLGVMLGGLGLGIPVVLTFLDTGLVPRLPTAVLSVGLVVLGWLSVFTGIILDVVAKARRESKRLAYLQVPLVRSAPHL